jgi:hypothetical protein
MAGDDQSEFPPHQRNELLPVLLLLRATHLPHDVVEKYVHENSEPPWVDLAGMRAERRWSHTEDLLIRAAESIWSGKGDCTLGEITAESLDIKHFRTVLEALGLVRGVHVSFSLV